VLTLTTLNVGLPPEHPTLPSLLKKVGYETTLIGKWHLGLLPKFGPLQSGYDHFFGFRGGALDYYAASNDAGVHKRHCERAASRAGPGTSIRGPACVG
jgi:arylsulfatase A-like enzyme